MAHIRTYSCHRTPKRFFADADLEPTFQLKCDLNGVVRMCVEVSCLLTFEHPKAGTLPYCDPPSADD